MKVLVGAFNQEKALVGAFSVIVELRTSRMFVPALAPTVICAPQCVHWLPSVACLKGSGSVAPYRDPELDMVAIVARPGPGSVEAAAVTALLDTEIGSSGCML